jgi:hypothetical protein
MQYHRSTAGRALVLGTAAAIAGCGPNASDQAARDASPEAVGTSPSNADLPTTPIETSSPEIANTAQESAPRTKVGASATPRARTSASVGGEGAPDVSVTAHQERPKTR